MALTVKPKADAKATGAKAEKKVASRAVTEEAKVAAGNITQDEANLKAGMEVGDQAANDKVGELSDKLHFIAALGDPSRDDITPASADGKKEKRVDPTIVGYQFKAEIDLEVPDCPPDADFSATNLMSCTRGTEENTRHVKAGEVFNLTKFETAMLISRPEFNARATGGDRRVYCSYPSTQRLSANGKIAKTSSTNAIPTIALKAESGSIKDYEMVPVLSYTKEVVNGRTKKTRTIIPGFEKWAALCADRVATRATGTKAATKANVRNEGAAAFLAIAKNRKAAAPQAPNA